MAEGDQERLRVAKLQKLQEETRLMGRALLDANAQLQEYEGQPREHEPLGGKAVQVLDTHLGQATARK
jgi:hypothetical protein